MLTIDDSCKELTITSIGKEKLAGKPKYFDACESKDKTNAEYRLALCYGTASEHIDKQSKEA